jgi:hypothetical protein
VSYSCDSNNSVSEATNNWGTHKITITFSNESALNNITIYGIAFCPSADKVKNYNPQTDNGIKSFTSTATASSSLLKEGLEYENCVGMYLYAKCPLKSGQTSNVILSASINGKVVASKTIDLSQNNKVEIATSDLAESYYKAHH